MSLFLKHHYVIPTCLSISLIHSDAVAVTYVIQRLEKVENFMEQVASMSSCSLCLMHTFHELFSFELGPAILSTRFLAVGA